MPVEFDRIPPQAVRPNPPRFWIWLYSFFILLALYGVGVVVFWDEEGRELSSVLGVRIIELSFIWWAAYCSRALYYVIKQRIADGWDIAREVNVQSRIQQGRRYLQVYAASSYTALRTDESDSQGQANAVLNGAKALKMQPSRLNGHAVRHSRLPGDLNEDPGRALLNILRSVLKDLAGTLAELGDDIQICLSLDVESRLDKDQVDKVWRKVCGEVGIRQLLVPIEWSALDAVERWLDQRHEDQDLLMVIVVVIAHHAPQDTAEAAVGLLFGSECLQPSLNPMAILHRPEQARGESAVAVTRAIHQSLYWASVQSEEIEHVWQAGIGHIHQSALVAALNEAELSVHDGRFVHNLDKLLGHPRKAAPWISLALAAQVIESGAGSQLILCGDAYAEAALWAEVMAPVPPLSRLE